MESIPSLKQGLRTFTRNERIHDLHGQDSFDVETTSKISIDSLIIVYKQPLIEQDHRTIKGLTLAGMGFKSFNTARQTLKGFEAINMIRKGQVKGITQGDSVGQAKFIAEIFGVSA